jgi:hypothetical protein
MVFRSLECCRYTRSSWQVGVVVPEVVVPFAEAGRIIAAAMRRASAAAVRAVQTVGVGTVVVPFTEADHTTVVVAVAGPGRIAVEAVRIEVVASVATRTAAGRTFAAAVAAVRHTNFACSLAYLDSFAKPCYFRKAAASSAACQVDPSSANNP